MLLNFHLGYDTLLELQLLLNLYFGLNSLIEMALGAAIGVGMIGKSAAEAVGRNPGAATKILVQAILSTAFAEGIVFFALFLWNEK